MAREYKLVSADSHLDLNPEVWTQRVPAKWRDRAPRVVVMSDGSDAVVCDGGEPNTIGLTRNVGVPFEEMPIPDLEVRQPGRQRHPDAATPGAGPGRGRRRDHVHLD